MAISNCMNLFAYGTLMDRDELAYNAVLPSSEVGRRLRIKIAELPGFRRIYNKPDPSQGGAVLNLEFHKPSSVVGVLFMDITHQELGMLDSSYPGHLPRKPVEVLVEGHKVPATVYLAKEVDGGAPVSEAYEKRVLELVHRLGEPILSSFLEGTVSADGTPRYRDPDPEPAGPPTVSGDAPAGSAP